MTSATVKQHLHMILSILLDHRFTNVCAASSWIY